MSWCIGADRGAPRFEARTESILQQPVKDAFPAADHVHGDVPRRISAADGRRRLMVAEHDENQVVGLFAQVTRQRPVLVRHRAHVARPEVRQIGA